MNKETIGNRIRKTRKERGITIKELADLMGCSQGHLSNIEKDQKEPGSRLLLLLKKHLKTTSDYLLEGKVDESVDIINNPKSTTMKIVEIVLNLEKLDGTRLDTALNFIRGLTSRKDTGQLPVKKKKAQ